MSSTKIQPDVMRMLTLVPWLLARPGASLAETAAAFATDVATIRAELDHLDYCGLPGLGGGALFDVTVVDDRVTVRMADELRYPMRPTPAETMRLLLIASAAEQVVGDQVPALRTAVEKLHRGLGVSPASVTVLDAEPDAAVRRARAAIAAGHRVRFAYRGRADREAQERVVDPWAVELSEGAWYLHGFDSSAGEARIFRLDRASDLVELDIAAGTSPPEELPLPAYEPGPADVEVRMIIRPRARWLLDAVEVEELGEPDEAGAVLARLYTGSPEWLVRLVLMAAGEAEVTHPSDLRERVLFRAGQALDRLR